MQQNQHKIVQFGGYRIPLAPQRKPAAQGLAGAAGSDLPETGVWRGEKSLIFQGFGGAKGRGSGLAAVRSYHDFSTLDARVLKLKVCSSKDVFLFTGRAYTHNCSEGNRKSNSKPFI